MEYCLSRLLAGPKVFLTIAVGLWSISTIGFAQTRLLDDFEKLEGWKTIVSEGAKLTLAEGVGKAGRALEMDFDLSGVYGYVIAEKEFSIDLPGNYQFTFDMRAEAPVNNFEFKVIDEKENVFWIKKLNVPYPKDWAKQRIKKRHLSFAWGPAPGQDLRVVRKIQFVVSVGTGGRGKVEIDNFRFEPIDDSEGRRAVASLEGRAPAGSRIDPVGTFMTNWRSLNNADQDSLLVNFNCRKEIGGLVIDWDSTDYAVSYDVLLSDDKLDWSLAYTVAKGVNGRAYIPTIESEGRFLKIIFHRSSRGKGYGIRRIEFKGPEFSSSMNNLYRAIAAESRPGLYPKYLQNRQSYWTVVGVNGDTKEALMNEEGQIEVDKLQFSLEPFLFVDGKLVTWSDVTTTPDLFSDYLPLPAVTWKYKNEWILNIEATAAGTPGKSLLGVKYTLQSRVSAGKAKLFVAIRPFQVNPPWQALNIEGGVSRIDSIVNDRGMIEVNGIKVVPMTQPTAFGATGFDQGDVTRFLLDGKVPPDQAVHDHFGHGSAVLQYDAALQPEEVLEVVLAVPFHGWDRSPVPNMGPGARIYYNLMFSQTANVWRQKLETFNIVVPAFAQDVVNTIRSNLAYIFINRDGPGIQPGSRSYERSWIRDGSLTCSALLRTGHPEEVKEFLDWYAKGQFPNGKIPCVIDSRGPDAVPEHDSNGEFIYAILQYYLFTKDTLWLRGKFDAVTKTVRYLQSLRAERKTDVYRNGTPQQKALYGILPESISHEGYWDVPRHSYWDDFFGLRGLKDATTIAAILGEKKLAEEWAVERDDSRKDLYASMRLAMKNRGVDYIPGCAELGDFDATSTTIGLVPGGELGHIPEPELHNTFDRYFKYFERRKTDTSIVNYTPYETRVIGSFVVLGQKKRAEEALDFFMKDRRPAEWNQWGEVVWRDPETPKYIGDMPHTWVGSDFIRSVLTMFVYDRESDGAHVLCAGIPDSWIKDSTGVTVENVRTYYGAISYSLHMKGKDVVAEVSGSFDAVHHPLIMKSPLLTQVRSVVLGGKRVSTFRSGEVLVKRLPATVEWKY